MKKLIMGLFACLTFSTLAEATVENVVVRQLWPWSTGVRVEYVLSGVTTPVDVTVECFNGEQRLPSTHFKEALKGELYGVATSEVHSFTIDPKVAFGVGANYMDFRVKLSVSESAADVNDVLYRVFDLRDGSHADVSRADILNGKCGSYETAFAKFGDGFNTSLTNVLVWTEVTNDVKYATTHLVMRKIPAAAGTWKIGSPAGENGADYAGIGHREKQYVVKLTEDYFIGVFPVTQAQYDYFKFESSNPSAFPEGDEAPRRPVETVRYMDLRGCAYAGTNKSADGQPVVWPTNSPLHTVAVDSTMDKLRKLTGWQFDLPSEAQWEFACRAGTTNALNSGKNLSATDNICPEMEEVGWFSGNANSTTHAVGQKAPNAYGLYDMHGNVMEVCNDWYVEDINVDGEEEPLVNPVGPWGKQSSMSYGKRGGCFGQTARYCRSANRNNSYDYTTKSSWIGFRVISPVNATW